MLRYLARLMPPSRAPNISLLRTAQKHWQPAAMSTISVKPNHGLVDSDLTINVHGLKPQKPYSLFLYLVESKIKFISCGHYVSNDKGAIDCVTDRCIGGSYDGIERHGLIWSMVQAPGQREGMRLFKRDVSTPYDIELTVHEGHKKFEKLYEEKDANPVARTTFHRSYMAPGVKRESVRHGRVRGMLFTPPGPGPFPAVIDLFGGAGGIVEFRAALLASHGLLSFNVAYFNHDDLQAALEIIDLDYFEEAVDYLLAHPKAKGPKLGVVGVSKGGEIASHMAAQLPNAKIGAVVDINGFNSIYTIPATYRGKFMDCEVGDMEKAYMTDTNALVLSETLRTFTPREEMTLKLENADAKFLFISSEGDLQVPHQVTLQKIERLKRFGKTNYEHLALGKGVGHIVEPCHSPFCPQNYQSNFQCILAFGGDAKSHTRGQELAWPKIISFLKENLDHENNAHQSKL